MLSQVCSYSLQHYSAQNWQAFVWQAARQGEWPDAAMHWAFALAAQYITLAYALQPTKEVYRKSLQVRINSMLSSHTSYISQRGGLQNASAGTALNLKCKAPSRAHSVVSSHPCVPPDFSPCAQHHLRAVNVDLAVQPQDASIVLHPPCDWHAHSVAGA